MSLVLDHLLSSILLAPVAGVLVLLVASGQRPGVIRGIACGVAAVTWALSIPLWFLYDPHGKTWQFAERAISMPSIGAASYVGADGFTVVLILLTTTVGLGITLAAWRAVRERVRETHILVLLMQAGLLGVFVALDFLLFLASWSVVLFTAYSIVRAAGGDGVRRGARAFLAAGAAGIVFVLAGILILYFDRVAATGLRSFDVALFQTLEIASGVQRRAYAFMVFGFVLSIWIPTFTRWLRSAHDTVPAIVVLSATLALVATFGIVRVVLPIVPDASREFAPATAALALAAALYSGVRLLLPGNRARVEWACGSVACLALAGTCGLAMPRSWPSVARIWPAPLERRIETSVGRVIGRVHPELAASLPRGSDCATPAPPEPAGPPPGFVLTAPCADGSDAAPKPGADQPVDR